jgi:integrase
MTTRKLTPGFCRTAAVEPGKQRSIYWDTEQRGFGLAVSESGHRSWVVQYRRPDGSGLSRRMTIDGVLGLAEARKRAKALLGKVALDRDPLGEKVAERLAKKRERETASKTSLKAICDRYLATEAREKKLRTIDLRRANLERLVYPALGPDRPIHTITRRDIRQLLDDVADNNGPVQADRVLALLSTIFNWWQRRDDDYVSPVVKGMARTSNKARERTRILDDEELRAVWKAAVAATEARQGPFGAYLMFCLLTGCRRTEAAQMSWAEVSNEGDWTLPAARNKVGVDLVRPLSPAAQDVLATLPKIGRYVFTSNGRQPLGGFSKYKRRFDAACGVSGWTLHDLRRTARSLMSRAGVNSDHAERCLGHIIGGVRGVYDRHAYHAEKKQAFEALAALIERIINPQDNVVPLRASGEV